MSDFKGDNDINKVLEEYIDKYGERIKTDWHAFRIRHFQVEFATMEKIPGIPSSSNLLKHDFIVVEFKDNGKQYEGCDQEERQSYFLKVEILGNGIHNYWYDNIQTIRDEVSQKNPENINSLHLNAGLTLSEICDEIQKLKENYNLLTNNCQCIAANLIEFIEQRGSEKIANLLFNKEPI